MKIVHDSCIIERKNVDGTCNLRKLSKLIFDRIIPLHLNIMKIYYKFFKKKKNFMWKI